MAENYQFETRCIHGDGGFVEGHPYGAVSVPIFQTATFAHPGIGKVQDMIILVRVIRHGMN